MLKFGVIGTGIVAERHLVAIESMKESCLVAVCDINEDRVNAVAKQFNVAAYCDYKEMMEKEEIDAVIINLPHGLHTESSIFCMDKGAHVFVEKPMANTPEECQMMIDASVRNDVKLVVGHVQKYFAHNIVAKKLVDSGKYGELVMITDKRMCKYFTPGRPKWFLNKKMAGGGISFNYGAHSMDITKWFTESKVESAYGSVGQRIEGIEVDGDAQFLVTMESGVVAQFTYSGYQESSDSECVLYLTKGAIKIRDYEVFASCDGGAYEKVVLDGFDESTYDAFVVQDHDFVDFVLGKEIANRHLYSDGEYSKDVIKAIVDIHKMSKLYQ